MSGAGDVGPGSLSESLGFPETVVELGPGHPAHRRALAAAGSTASFVVQLDDDCITGLEVEESIRLRIDQIGTLPRDNILFDQFIS